MPYKLNVWVSLGKCVKFYKLQVRFAVHKQRHFYLYTNCNLNELQFLNPQSKSLQKKLINPHPHCRRQLKSQ